MPRNQRRRHLRAERDPDDDATLTEIMKKKKVLEDKKKELDEKVTPPAPSESKIDLGVFSAKHGNLLEKIYAASGSQGVKSGKGTRKVDISKITPPTSPPSRIFGISPLHTDLGKRKEDDVEVEQVGEGGAGAGGDGGDGGRGEGVIRGSREGGASRTHHSLEYEYVQGGSWDTHNPTCADLPHAPRWNLTQGSRMTDLGNCREFFSLSLPPAERLFQKRCNQMDLLDDYIHAGVNFFATSQEIARERQLMGEDTLEFEAVKKAFAEVREKFNAEKKGLSWRVADAEEKLAKEKQFNANKQKELSGEKTKISEEAEQERVAHQKREHEYIQHIAKLEKIAAEKVMESKAAEILAEEVTTDCKWLLARAVPPISERIAKSDELAKLHD
ncbi:hypothetical protein Hanom_Chr10g00915251 [Helianthus anomalus]